MLRFGIFIPLLFLCNIAICQYFDPIAKFEFDYIAITTAGIKSDPVKYNSSWSLYEISGNFLWVQTEPNGTEYYFTVINYQTFPEGTNYSCTSLDGQIKYELTLIQKFEVEGIGISSPSFPKNFFYFTLTLK